MKAAILELQTALDAQLESEQINRRVGDNELADAAARASAEIRQALVILRAAEAGPIWPQPSPDGEISITGTLFAGAVIAESVEVFDRSTGEVQELVHAVNIDEGWIDQLQLSKMVPETSLEGPLTFFGVPRMSAGLMEWAVGSGKPDLRIEKGILVQRIHGNWGARLKPA